MQILFQHALLTLSLIRLFLGCSVRPLIIFSDNRAFGYPELCGGRPTEQLVGCLFARLGEKNDQPKGPNSKQSAVPGSPFPIWGTKSWPDPPLKEPTWYYEGSVIRINPQISWLRNKIVADQSTVQSVADTCRPLQNSVISGQFVLARTAWISLEEEMRNYV